MGYRKWRELEGKLSPERRERIRRQVKAELFEMDLKEMRAAAGMTQVDLANTLEMSQGQVSETERRDDLLLSTLRRYVEALGGELEIIANFGDRRIRLRSV